jgi:hypothetical protein
MTQKQKSTAPAAEATEEPALTDSTTVIPADLDSTPIPDATAVETDSYFKDDEDFLEAGDELVHSAKDIAVFLQKEKVVTWELKNFYDLTGKPRSKVALRNDPPMLGISNSDGEEVEFLLSAHFAQSLGATLENVHRAYYGVAPRLDPTKAPKRTLGERLGGLKTWALVHKVRAASLLLLLAAIVAALFVF